MILAYGFIKLSVLYFYRRIFVAGMGRFNIVSNVVIAIVVLWTVGFLLVQIFSCGSHFNYNWGPLVDQLSCVAGLQYLEGLMISDFVTDLLVFFLPFGMVISATFLGRFYATLIGIIDLATSRAN